MVWIKTAPPTPEHPEVLERVHALATMYPREYEAGERTRAAEPRLDLQGNPSYRPLARLKPRATAVGRTYRLRDAKATAVRRSFPPPAPDSQPLIPDPRSCHPSTSTMCTSFGPCTPTVSVSSISAVRLGPVISAR